MNKLIFRKCRKSKMTGILLRNFKILQYTFVLNVFFLRETSELMELTSAEIKFGENREI